ncbi:hypothetical protein BIU82_08305 [Arthrobacter sp. SW1]|nr:hypothetical protein BIU82_08305 [Arthrobacter sp. SW1]
MGPNRRGRVALMSIRPEFAHAILEGTKTVEFRKRPVASDVSHVLIYATMPIGALLGWFVVEGQYTTEPHNLWRRFRSSGAISKDRFFEYFSAKESGTGIRVGSVVKFEQPLLLSTLDGVGRAPQSFQYLSEEQATVFFDRQPWVERL